MLIPLISVYSLGQFHCLNIPRICISAYNRSENRTRWFDLLIQLRKKNSKFTKIVKMVKFSLASPLITNQSWLWDRDYFSLVHVWTRRSHVGVVLSHGVLTVEEALLSTMFCDLTSVCIRVSPYKLWDVLLKVVISGHSCISSIQDLCELLK